MTFAVNSVGCDTIFNAGDNRNSREITVSETETIRRLLAISYIKLLDHPYLGRGMRGFEAGRPWRLLASWSVEDFEGFFELVQGSSFNPVSV